MLRRHWGMLATVAIFASGSAGAQSLDTDQVERMQRQMEQLQEQMKQVKSDLGEAKKKAAGHRRQRQQRRRLTYRRNSTAPMGPTSIRFPPRHRASWTASS